MPIQSYVNISLETEPTAPKHLVTLQKVLELISGKFKAPVSVVATTPQAGTYAPAPDFEFTYTALEALEIDGVALAVGDRVLLTAQANDTENGIYVVTNAGEDGPTPPAEAAILTRSNDFNDSTLIEQGVQVNVSNGTLNSGTTWRLVTGGTITLDSTALEFQQVKPTTGASKYAETITGDSATTDFTINHDLGTTDVTVDVYNLANHMMVLTDITVTDSNNIEIGFADAPAPSGVFRVVVVG